MGFGVDLQGKESHEALLRVQDGEIRLLENMKKCLSLRVDSDRRYVSALMQFVQQAQKLEPAAEFSATCTVFKAWDVIVRETKEFVRHLTCNADELCMRALDKLNCLISEKKAAKKFYTDERNRLEIDFARLTDDVQKMQSEYYRIMERLAVDQGRYEELHKRQDINTSKGKIGKLDEARHRYIRTTVRLHRLHNSYVIGLKEVVMHQSDYLQHTLPCLLDYHQVTQQILVQQCKDLLLDYSRITNLGNSKFLHVYQTIQSAVEEINADIFIKDLLLDYSRITNLGNSKFLHVYQTIQSAVEEINADANYTSFIDQHTSNPLQPVIFTFDERLLQDFTGSLKSNEISVTKNSAPALMEKKSEIEDSLAAQRKYLGDKTKDLTNLQAEINKLKQQVSENSDEVTKNDFYVKRRAIEIIKREVRELECGVSKNVNLLEFIETSMSKFAEPYPEALDLQDVQSEDNISIDIPGSHSTLEGIRRKFKDFTGNFKRPASSLPSLDKTPVNEKSDDNSNTESQLSDVQRPDIHRQDTHLENVSPMPDTPKPYEGMVENGIGGFTSVEDSEAQLSQMEWFHGILPRDEVQRLLQKDGDFIVRESKNKKTNDTTYVLSVFWTVPKHFIILNVQNGWRFEGQIFPTIPDLIDYQYQSGEPVTSKSQAILTNPVTRSDWELNNDDIQLLQKIGNGNFGEVFKGMYTPRNLIVAVKTCRDTLSEDQKRKFLGEGRILKQYNHANIVKFIGIATQRQPVMIIMEFCSGGALLNFLRKQGKLQPKRTLVQMCLDAASGMEYLEARGCIHRDLATRNCLISEHNVVKISDFGMSREEEEYTVSEGLKQIPIKWTAPEALNFGRYTSLCDVWSFGVLMWEVFSFGQTPYTGMSNAQARERIEEGMRLQSPDGTPRGLYELMRNCWEYEPENRLHFHEITYELKEVLNSL